MNMISSKQLNTPKKRIKLTRPVELKQRNIYQQQSILKKNLFEYFQVVGTIIRQNSNQRPPAYKQFQKPFPQYLQQTSPQSHNSQQLVPYFTTQNLSTDIKSQNSQQDQFLEQIKLAKKITMFNNINQYVMEDKLFRCNSGIDIEEGIIEADQRKYGDNIYIEQIYQLKRTKTKKSKESNKIIDRRSNNGYNNRQKRYKKNFSDDEEDQVKERLLKDYEISSNFHVNIKNHENYLCLSKLQRIFYYIKKISLSDQQRQKQIFDLCQLQVRLYNRDEQSHMLRFYQSWQQDQCIYLVFETASTSLQQKLLSGIKLRQNEVWSLLSDCCGALSWMKGNNQYHLNIKPGNVLKCREKFKVADPFGSFQCLEKEFNVFKGEQNQQYKLTMAYAYAAPQLIKYRSFICGLDLGKCDIYSLGICILQNISGIPISMLKREFKKVKGNNEKYLRGYSPALRSVVMRMSCADPGKRPTAEEIYTVRKLECCGGVSRGNNREEKCSPNKRKMSW